jgi:hypothetical protein
MFGAFKTTFTALGGLVNKRRFRLTKMQKYRQTKRLKQVDQVVDVLAESGVKFRALDIARLAPRTEELTPFQKYWVPSKRYRDGFKPINWVPKWTKAPHPRKWESKAVHELEPPKDKDTEWKD